MRHLQRLLTTRQVYYSLLSQTRLSKPIQQKLLNRTVEQRRQTSFSRNLPELTLFSKAENCSLCDDAKEVLIKHCHLFVFNEVDITAEGNEHWYHLYKHDIPVVHIDGTEVMRHRVFENVLLDALEIASGRA